MIIVNQEKTYLVNFNNVCQASLAVDEEETEYAIVVQTVDKEKIIMGIYATEERTKEVLREIYCRYEHSQSLLSSKCISVQDFMGKDFIYEMPEEEDYEK